MLQIEWPKLIEIADLWLMFCASDLVKLSPTESYPWVETPTPELVVILWKIDGKSLEDLHCWKLQPFTSGICGNRLGSEDGPPN
jgi:hypothetical protein